MHWGEEDLTWKDVKGVVIFAGAVVVTVFAVIVLDLFGVNG